MNNHRENNNWPNDQYHNYNRHQQSYHNQHNWHPENERHDWGQNRNDFNRHNQNNYSGNHDRRMMDNNRQERHSGWQHDFPPSQDQHQYDHYDNHNSRNRDFDGRYGMPNNYDTNAHYQGGPNYDQGESHYGYDVPERQHRNNSGAYTAASAGGSFTSYSASRSRSRSRGMDHGRTGGMIHREGPGMNGYYRGDINANSNW